MGDFVSPIFVTMENNRMKLNELASNIQRNLEEELIDEWSETHEDIADILTKKGYKLLGSGVDQTAFLEPGTGLVLKIFGTQDASHSKTGKVKHTKDHKMFFEWAKYCMANADNPFLPKFSGFTSFIYDNQTYLQIRQERLTECPSDLGHTIEAVSDNITAVPKQQRTIDKILPGAREHLGRWYQDDLSTLEKYLRHPTATSQLLLTMAELSVISTKKGYVWDLHSGNVMMRGKTPVIVDPWVVPRW